VLRIGPEADIIRAMNIRHNILAGFSLLVFLFGIPFLAFAEPSIAFDEDSYDLA
jgi:hypothetical protein